MRSTDLSLCASQAPTTGFNFPSSGTKLVSTNSLALRMGGQRNAVGSASAWASRSSRTDTVNFLFTSSSLASRRPRGEAEGGRRRGLKSLPLPSPSLTCPEAHPHGPFWRDDTMSRKRQVTGRHARADSSSHEQCTRRTQLGHANMGGETRGLSPPLRQLQRPLGRCRRLKPCFDSCMQGFELDFYHELG